MTEEGENPYYDSWEQAVTEAMAPKIPAFLSFVGSSCIIREVLHDHRKMKGGTIKRILLAMSVIDLFSSFSLFLSTWPSPKGTPVAFAFGTTETCTAQGFLLQIGVGSALYSAALAMAYLLVVRFGWKEKQLKTIEPWVHGIVLAPTMAAALAGLPLTLYNNAHLACWISGYPMECNESWQGGKTDCTRGDNSSLYGFVFSLIPIWIGFIVITCAMILMVLSTRKIERRSLKWTREAYRSSLELEARENRSSLELTTREENRSSRELEKTKLMSVQAYWFIGCYFLTYIPSTIGLIMYYGFDIWFFWFDVLVTSILSPAQGFFNFLVFARKRKQMHSVMGRGLQYFFFGSWCLSPLEVARILRARVSAKHNVAAEVEEVNEDEFMDDPKTNA